MTSNGTKRDFRRKKMGMNVRLKKRHSKCRWFIIGWNPSDIRFVFINVLFRLLFFFLFATYGGVCFVHTHRNMRIRLYAFTLVKYGDAFGIKTFLKNIDISGVAGYTRSTIVFCYSITSGLKNFSQRYTYDVLSMQRVTKTYSKAAKSHRKINTATANVWARKTPKIYLFA